MPSQYLSTCGLSIEWFYGELTYMYIFGIRSPLLLDCVLEQAHKFTHHKNGKQPRVSMQWYLSISAYALVLWYNWKLWRDGWPQNNWQKLQSVTTNVVSYFTFSEDSDPFLTFLDSNRTQEFLAAIKTTDISNTFSFETENNDPDCPRKNEKVLVICKVPKRRFRDHIT